MGDQVVSEFQKNGAEKVVAQLTCYKGHDLADLRVFYRDDGGEYRASKKGLCVSVALLPQLEEAVRALREAAAEKGLPDGEE